MKRFELLQRTRTVLVGIALATLAEAPAYKPERIISDAVAQGRDSKELSASDWSQIRGEYERHRRSAVADGEGHRARNPQQQWLARFDGRGFLLQPDHGDWRWGLELTEYGIAEAGRAVNGKARVTAERERVRYAWGETLEEWFVNEPHGLEHGFTVKRRPEGGAGTLHLRLAVRGGLRAEGSGSAVRFVNGSGGAVVSYSGLKAWDADGRALAARMESEAGNVVRLTVEDRGARYPVTIDPIAQQAYLKASNPEEFDYFGGSVAVSGDTAVVGARFEDSSATGVNGNQADNSAPYSGAAYVFVRSGGVWTQQAYLKASNTGETTSFGGSVAISGDTVVVGARGETANGPAGGAAYVFVRTFDTWTEQAHLTASNPDVQDQFGGSVAVSGDTVVVGASFEDSAATGVNGDQSSNRYSDSGAAYVFVRIGATWSQQAYLKASNTAAGDFFGSVSVSGDTVVVGAPLEDSNATGVNGNQNDNSSDRSGAAYVFVRSAGVWTQQAYLKASNTGALDEFGGSVAVSGDTVVAGARGESSNATGVNGNQGDNSAPYAGAAYVFVRNLGSWSQQAYVKASNTDAYDQFGGDVSVSGNTVVTGASGERSNATGVNGDQANNSAQNSGAAYVFVRNAGVWSQQDYLKASNTEAFDYFGGSVAVSGDAVIVGAVAEDSEAGGVDGNQADNSAQESGAAYLFSPSSPCALDVSLSYQQGTLTSNWTIGTTEPLTFWGYLLTVSGVSPLWRVGVPAFNPPVQFQIRVPLPPSGNVGMLGLLTQPGSLLCADLALVNTSGAGGNANDLREATRWLIQEHKAGRLPGARP